MNIFPNNKSKKDLVSTQNKYFPKCSNTGTAPYFQNYYPYSNYLDGPANDYFGTPKKKKSGFFTTAFKWLAIGTAGFMGFKFAKKHCKAIPQFFRGLLGK